MSRATGIVRRIDDLGRVVIPKEVRRTMDIQEGDPMEIFINREKGEIIFTKYEPVSEVRFKLQSMEERLLGFAKEELQLNADQFEEIKSHFEDIAFILGVE